MQDRLIQRYLGNKSAIAREIVETVEQFASPNDLIFDAFAGTLSVSAALREAGYRVVGNDINHFTWTFATAYFSSPALPMPDKFHCISQRGKEAAWARLINQLVEPYANDIPPKAQLTNFYDHYCEDGGKSAFASNRGKTGNRRFFSPENAILMDRALSRIRYWYRECGLSEINRCILIASILSAVEKVSNTQGTYHDFPREYFDPRAKQGLNIKAPRESDFNRSPSIKFGKAKDTLDFVKSVPKHKVMYLDPPYNFRQYTAYYFMLNLISEYPEIDDIEEYFSKVEYVRGQNMGNDFKSSFCGKSTFIPALKNLISSAKTDYVILSYFDGRNHWGSFKSKSGEIAGKELIRELFEGDLFVEGSYNCVPIERLNYQSYGGYNAGKVSEFIFTAKKRKLRIIENDSEPKTWTGKSLATPKVSLAG